MIILNYANISKIVRQNTVIPVCGIEWFDRTCTMEMPHNGIIVAHWNEAAMAMYNEWSTSIFHLFPVGIIDINADAPPNV